MITQETAQRIYATYREIEVGQQLLADMEKIEKAGLPFDKMNRTEPRIKDAFGRRQHLQLGIPQGETGHRLLEVSPDLGKSIIRSHISKTKAALDELQEQARNELDQPEADHV